jgi:hypothetical protein
LRFGVRHGFGRQPVAEGPEARELLVGAAIEALGLGLIAEEESDAVGAAGLHLETLGQGVGAVLGLGDLDAVGEVVGQGEGQVAFVGEGGVEARGSHSGFEGGDAKEGLLGEGHALEGEEFLGVDGLPGGDEVLSEAGDGVEFFEADDGEVGGGEGVLAGVLGGDGLALRSAGTGGAGGVGSVGGEAPGGSFSGFRHSDSAIARGRAGSRCCACAED